MRQLVMLELSNQGINIMKNNTTIYIVDDDDAILDSLKWMIEGWGYIVQTCLSAESFFSYYNPYKPAAIFLDVRLNGNSGLELQDILINRGLKIPIVFITGHGDVPMAVNVLKKGAIDFIQKPFNNTTIKSLVEHIYEIAPAYFENQQKSLILMSLSSRERQVLKSIASGKLNKQIASDLNLSIKTVEAHRANIMKKLEATGVADLVKYFLLDKDHELFG
jgi:two-component system, LuxR family, response regulator TtrR